VTKVFATATQTVVQRMLCGDEPARHLGRALELITTDADGRPQVSVLSVGEVLVVGPDEWRLGLYSTGSTAERLRTPGAEALCTVVADGALHGHGLVVRRSWELTVSGQCLVGVVAEVREVTIDRSGYADLTAGPTYALTVPTGPVVQRWTDTLSALRAG